MKKLSSAAAFTAIASTMVMLAGQMAWAQDGRPQRGGDREGARQGGDRGDRGGRGGFGGDRGRGGFDPERMEEFIMQGYKRALQSTDEEWSVIQPLVMNAYGAMNKNRTQSVFSALGGFGGGRGPGGDRGFGGPRGDRGDRGPGGDRDFGGRGGDRGFSGRGFGPPPSPETEALIKLLRSDDPSADDVKAKLAAYRESRERNQKAYEEAGEQLRAVLTVRQEAAMVLAGLLK